VPRTVVRPIQIFMQREASGGIVLAIAAVVALAWANLDIDSYSGLWDTHLRLSLGGWVFDESLRHVVNDGLMTLFFFVIGLEVKREFTVGELQDRRAALLPLFAAIGGMAVPALAYITITRGHIGAQGWGIPMATDIAFALGVLALLGHRVPLSLKVLLLGIAVIDDIGAILVIAIFYSHDITVGWLLVAAVGLLSIEACKRLHIRAVPIYITLGIAVWLATFESGIHATIAGVIIGLITPARPFQNSDAVSDAAHSIAHETTAEHDDPDEDAAHWRRLAWLSKQSISPLALAQHTLHPWTSYVILPLFALANVGIVITPSSVVDTLTSPIGTGVLIGLVVGKPVGVLVGSALAVRFGIAHLPSEIRWLHVAGVGALSGIGFTVSIFITALAFESSSTVISATFAVLVASCIAGVVGALLLTYAHRRSTGTVAHDSDNL